MTRYYPQRAGDVIAGLIKKHGEARPDRLVEDARDDKHPLHGDFEWNDSAAGHEYRLLQASALIRSVTIIRDDRPDVHLRAFVNVDREGGYRSLDTVLSRPDDRAKLLEQALGELQAFARKYETLKELDRVRAEIDRVASKGRVSKRRSA
jgi:hypothetical protein